MARRRKAEVGDVLELKGNVVIVYPDGSTVTGRRSFTPPRPGTYKVHDGNSGEVIATYAVTALEEPAEPDDVDQDDAGDQGADQGDAGDQAAAAATETAGAGEGQADASAPGDPAPADDQAGA